MLDVVFIAMAIPILAVPYVFLYGFLRDMRNG